MQSTTHYSLNKFESTDKMYQNTMDALNTNADTIDTQLYNNDTNIGIRDYGGELLLVDGTPISNMTNTRYYRITGLKVNGTADNDFSYSIVFFWTSGSNQYVNYITKWSGHNSIFGKQYKYVNGEWTLDWKTEKVTQITSSSTNDEIPTAQAVYNYVDTMITQAIGGSY